MKPPSLYTDSLEEEEFKKVKGNSLEEALIIDSDDELLNAKSTYSDKRSHRLSTSSMSSLSMETIDEEMASSISVNSQLSSMMETRQSLDSVDLEENSQSLYSDRSGVESQQSNSQQFSQQQEQLEEDRVRSYYLYHFLEILETVTKRDGHLFIEEEQKIIEAFKNQCKASQRLFIRLFNRKQKYFTITELEKYRREIEKEKEDIMSSWVNSDEANMQIVCCENIKDALEHLVKSELFECLHVNKENNNESSSSSKNFSNNWTMDEIQELLREFTNKQLKSILDKKNISNVVKKQLSKRSSKESPKSDLIKQIITRPESLVDLKDSGGSGKQSKLSGFFKKQTVTANDKCKDEDKEKNMTSSSNSSPNSSTLLRTQDVLKLIHKASSTNKDIAPVYYRIHKNVSKIFKRIHHLYFISQNSDNASIMILEQKKITIFPKYEVQEQKSLFETREDLLRYEEAFEIANTWADSLDSPSTESTKSSYANPSSGDVQNTQDLLIIEIETRLESIQKANEDGLLEKLVEFSKDICQRLEEDTELIRKKYSNDSSSNTLHMDYYLMRFRCGYVYARILHYCTKLLEKHKQYELAISHLNAILKSPFMVGKRGEFYNRIALDYEHQKTVDCYEKAYETCKIALSDNNSCEFFGSIRLPPNKRCTLEKRYLRICKKLQKSDPKKYSTLDDSSLISTFISTNVKPPKLIYIQGKVKKLESRKKGEKRNHFISHLDQETVVSVEQFALEHYQMKHAMEGIHSEGSIWAMLFMLVMWDIIFDSSIPYVFQNKYQSCPLDFMTDAFYLRRRDKFKKRLEEIEQLGSTYLIEKVTNCWNENYGTNAISCNWKDMDPTLSDEDATIMTHENDDEIVEVLDENVDHVVENKQETAVTSQKEAQASESIDIAEKPSQKLTCLISICECFPIKVICTILQSLAEDMKENRSGFPDLVCWKKSDVNTTNASHEHLLSEIKGPNDKLSEKQIIWIDLLAKAGANVEVCHVRVRDGSCGGTDNSQEADQEEPTKKKRKSSSSSQITFADDDLWKQLEDDVFEEEN
ncbi:hypothetical protein C9374_008544 [Naegleria lovaniensis]|uniref:Fanconi-associated nuclease n=1 Tax=Naegleria lovaniensis TaxID=51637 RepID=A0AA88KHP8_NAELO|nr:uncharacterized protein C9374_008544 [Naegleria lovaniensis]KAG2378401.1 hypothetical protein C9374_008544 [Naegleria lovaniensis]